MKYRVVFRDEARDEALAAADYIAAHSSVAAAGRWYSALGKAIASLSVMPRRCSPAREQPAHPGAELRQLIFKSHRLVVTIRGNQVHVLHVRHAARSNFDNSDLPTRDS